MANIALDDPRPLPVGVTIAGSVAVGLHLAVIGCLALGAQSGPWPTPMGPSMAEGPQFVKPLTDVAVPNYLQPLRMTHNYHFMTNSLAQPGVYFEVHLKDKSGQRLRTVKFPDDKANPWVRHRQQLLAQGLAQDQPVPPPQGELIGAAGQRVEMMVWLTPDEIKRIVRSDVPQPAGDNELYLRKVAQHLVPRDRPVMTASDLSLTLAKSYARYLCRTQRAASAEVIRHTREAWQPSFLFIPREGVPPNDKLVCNFGEFTRD